MTQRDVEEALSIYDELTEDQQRIALEYLKKSKEDAA